jgi:hypothetical protein
MTVKVSKFQAVLSSRETEEAIDSPLEILPVAPVPKMGRPKGKRSDPAYTQVTSYIRQDTYTKVRVLLLQKGEGQEFSELVEELLHKFLEIQTSESLEV